MKSLCKCKNKTKALPLWMRSVRFSSKLCLYFVLTFFIFFLSSISNQVFADRYLYINEQVSHNIYVNNKNKDEKGKGPPDNNSNNNRLIIGPGATINGSIWCGTYSLENFSSFVAFPSNNNTIIINGGVISATRNSNLPLQLFSGVIIAGESPLYIAKNNKIEINGGVIDVSHVIGGRSFYNGAIHNSVVINNGTISNSIKKVVIYGGMSSLGNATDNTVVISGGTVNAYVVFGGVSFFGGKATNNTVTISQGKNINVEYLCGGLTRRIGKTLYDDSITGNTLNIKGSGLTVKGVSNFQNYNFYLPSDIQSGASVLTSENGEESVLAYPDENEERHGNKEFDEVSKTMHDTIYDPDGKRQINLTGKKINVYSYSASGKLLHANDSFSLIETQQGFKYPINNGDTELTLKQGFAFRYDCKLELSKDDTALKLLVVSDAKFNQEVKSFSEGRTASVAFLNQGSDVISDKGLSEAVISVSPNSVESVSYFTAASGVKLKYNTGSHVNVNGISALTGLAKGIDVKFGQLTTGAFFEYGSSNYNTSNSFSEFPSVEGGGNAEYKGGGVLGYFDFRNNFYGEVSGRIGSITTAFYSLDITYDPDVFAKYNYNTLYTGAHVGGGYLWDINSKLGLNLYGKCFFTHQNGKDVVLPTSEVVKFADTNSKRVCVGAKFSNNVNKDVSLYCGVAYEYELDGIVNATMLDRNIPAPSLRGGTGAGEIGVKGSVGTCCIDLSAQGYTGSREGFSGTLRFSFAFFNYTNRFLGYSLEKFYDKENTGRFNQMFNMSKKECFDKSLDIIKELKARVTHKGFRKGYIVAFDFLKSFESICLDSTEACIFITETESGNVNVEVVSTNSFLAQEFSVEFFKMLGQDSGDTNA